jgi:small subunit ribosomal protein S16
MLAIRLARVGKKKHPTYRIIVSEKARDTLGTYLELLGNYNPHANPPETTVNAERVRHWIDRGAKASPTVQNLLITAKIIEGKKVPQGRLKKKADAAADAAKPAAS